MNLKRILFFLLLLKSTLGFSQSFNVEQLGKSKLVNVSGGASLSNLFYSGNAMREPYSYFLNGNININIAGLYNLPFSFSYTNQKLGYNKPVLMNRLSIHPSYKWATAHIGDVSMTFSPYTLSGHLFTGFGVDLTPQGKFKISAMYGRLLKSSEYNALQADLAPAYKRFGYGFKTQYSLEKVNLGLSFFKAEDQINSLSVPIPFELGITPKENVAISLETSFKLFKKLQVLTEIANSSVTEDTRVTDGSNGKSLGAILLNSNSTTNAYNAFKAQFVYPAGKGTLGLGYERIDPNYRTLGGYFFNNDLENITVNASQTLYKDKLALSVNLGLQKDNLDKQKQSQMKRLVSALNADFKANEKLNINVNYSNFQSYTNSRNQFDYINQSSNFDYLDTLNFRQVNQSGALTVNYLLKNDKKRKQALNANLSIQDAVNQQEGKTIAGGATTFYNSGLSYIMGLPEKELNLTASVNSTIGKIENGNSLIVGPTIGATKLYFERKLNTSFSSSYNTSYSNGDKQNDVINFRLNGSYLYQEKHNFSLNAIALFSTSKTTKNNDLTATLTYTYSFDKIKLRKVTTVPKDQTVVDPVLKINYNSLTFEGTKMGVLEQLEKAQLLLKPLPASETEKLNKLLEDARMTTDEKAFKDKALDYLEHYSEDEKVITRYHSLVSDVSKKLHQEMTRKDESFENAYVAAMGKVNGHKMHGVNSADAKDKISYNAYLKLAERARVSQNKLINHRWMMRQFSELSQTAPTALETNAYLANFSQQEIAAFFENATAKNQDAELIQELEQKIIPFFHQLAVTNAVNEEVELKY